MMMMMTTTTVMTYLSAWLPCKDDAVVDDETRTPTLALTMITLTSTAMIVTMLLILYNNNHCSVFLPSPSFAGWRIIQTPLKRHYGS
jgi:type IV secretory pathway VirB3-like protein